MEENSHSSLTSHHHHQQEQQQHEHLLQHDQNIEDLHHNNPDTTTTTTTTTSHKSHKKLELLPLIFLIYFEVAGGPFGEEAAVGGGGPLLAIIGFLIFPFIWSIPEALVTAELATTFPGNGGFVIWANEAFGPFWGSLMGFWKFFSGVINMAAYPVLCIDYMKVVIPSLSSGFPRFISIFISTSLMSFLNFIGLTIVGYAAVCLGVVSLLPFLLMSLISITKIDPTRWFSLGQEGVKKNWTLYFNTLFWNLNFWDNASTLAGEIDQPQKTIPKALFSAGLLTCLAYIIPLLAATGALPLEQRNWVNGYFADVAEIIAGKWLKFWMEIGAVLSVIGLFEAQLSSASFQILGMADLGFMPRIFGMRSRMFNTPWMGILVSTVIALAMSYFTFADIISTVNFLYSLGMLLEFASYLRLRSKFPGLKRPFEVPMRLPGLVVMCLIPSMLLVYVMSSATLVVYVTVTLMTVSGVGLYYLMNICKSKKWIEFTKVGEKLDGDDDLYSV